MTDLERRALLGDRQAQEECTRRGIALPCPICGKKEVLALHSNGKIYHNYTIECVFNGRFVKLKDWNTRPAPPIGRCGECKHWYKQHCAHGPCATEPTDADFSCGGFEPKGGEEK